MEKKRKDLKIYSILILAFVAISLIKIIVTTCINGFPQVEEIPEGMTETTVRIVTIIAFVLSFIVLLPQVYVGIKGLKISAGVATEGKAHLTWAIVLAVVAAFSVISSIIEATKAFDVKFILNAVDSAVDVLLFISYYLLVRKIASEK